MEFQYNYLTGETPEERLRNKIQPLFSLVDVIAAGGKPSVAHMAAAIESKGDIRKLLDDITPYYTSVDRPKYTQNNTLNEEDS